MLEKLKNMKKYRSHIEIGLSLMLFLTLLLFGDFVDKFNFANVVYVLLGYVVILELTRMIGEYIVENQVKISSIIETFIIFMLREMVLVYSNQILTIEQKAMYILMGIIMITSLFFFRKKSFEDCRIKKSL